jgi:hypothetical protein
MKREIIKNKRKDAQKNEKISPLPQEDKQEPMNSKLQPEYKEFLTNLAFRAVPRLDPESKEKVSFHSKITETAFEGINPLDTVEGLIATQMLALHNAAMDCFFVAGQAGYQGELKNFNLTQGVKLSNAFSTMTALLMNYRGRTNSPTPITVKQVEVKDGGQAIVGIVNSRAQGKN